jgi:hypothetical protein
MKYSLRSLFIVVTLAGVCLAVWATHRKLCLERASMHQTLAIPNVGADMNAAIARSQRHQRLSAQYRSAVWQPWLRLWIDDKEAP